MSSYNPKNEIKLMILYMLLFLILVGMNVCGVVNLLKLVGETLIMMMTKQIKAKIM